MPKKLDKFRLTSTDRRIIEAVAEVYGGKAKAWQNGAEQQYEVFTETAEIPIVLPPDPSDMGWSQFYESWAKGFCTRRCDGEWDTVRDEPCDCDPEGRDCKITSRLSIFLPEIPGLGVWRLESHGYYAGVELAGAIEIIESLAGVRAMVPARLRMVAREVRRLKDGQPETHQFVVPAIDIDVSVAQVQALNAGVAVNVPAVEARPQGWKAVPAAPAPKALGIAEQLDQIDKAPPAKKRANAAAPIASTGRKPRTAAEREKANEPRTCARCGQSVIGAPVVRNPDGEGYVHKAECMTASEPERFEDEIEGPDGADDDEPEESPAPTPSARVRQPTAKMHSKIFATLAEVFPIPPNTPDADVIRRNDEIQLCEALGRSGITSHKDIDYDLAMVMIDTLTAVLDGKVRVVRDDDIDGIRLFSAESGEAITFGADQ